MSAAVADLCEPLARMESVDAGELSTDTAAGVPARRALRRRPTEAALVRAAQAGSEQAVSELFDLHWDAVHRAAYLITHDRAAAEDIAQEAFLAALRALPRFDRRRPLRPWLHRIVVNRAIDWARTRQLRREVDAEAVGEIAGPDAATGAEGWPDHIADALAGLPPDQRAV